MSMLPAFLAGIGTGAAIIALVQVLERRARSDAAYILYSRLLTTYPKTKGGRS